MDDPSQTNPSTTPTTPVSGQPPTNNPGVSASPDGGDAPKAKPPTTPSGHTPDIPSPPPTTPTSPPFPISPPPSDEASPPSTDQESSPPPPLTPTEPPPPEPGEPAQVVEPLFKRLIPILIGVGVLILIFLLVAKLILPATKKNQEPETISLKYWGLWEPETIVSTIIKDYQATHPNVTIQYTRQTHQDYRERLQSALARGDGPDIFRWHNTWLPMLKADLAPVPDNIYSTNEFTTTFYPVVKTDASINNKYYGIPLEFDALALYVNEDIFAANPDLKIPTTWDNLRQAAFKLKKLDANNNLIRGGIALGTTENVDNFSDILGLMILQNGGDPGQPETEAVSSAIQFYTLFSTQDQSWHSSLPNSTYAFATEKVAMIIAPSWRALEISQINPSLNFKLYTVPQLPGTNVSWASYWLEGVSKKSANSAAAFEFLKYLSSKEALTKMYTQAAQARLFGEPYSRQDMASSLQNDPYLGAIISQAISAQSWPLASRTFDNGLNDKLIKYYQDAVNSSLQNKSDKNTTQALTQGVSQILQQYGLAN